MDSRALVRDFAAAAKLAVTTLRDHLRLDVPIAIFAVVYLALFAPLVPRNTDNPQLLAAYANDEPFITMALEATLVPPFGNPGAYFDPQNEASQDLPDHWADMRYPNISYYGGALYQLAFPPYAVLRALGAPAFPTGPIVLRVLTLLAGLLSLIVLYNFAKERGSRLAGLLAAAYLASDGYFLYYAGYIHPDTLQLLFGLCAFLLAIVHARDGSRASLVALGLFCGLVQGTKTGGPWTIPMALLAVWLGARARGALERGLGRRLLSQTLVLGLAALVGFFVSTPYAFLDTYYKRSLEITYGIVTSNQLHLTEDFALVTWAEALYDYIGPLGAVLLALTIARALYVNRRSVADPALALGVVLALSQFVWYGTAGRVWLVLGYLVLSFGVMSALAFETLFLGVRALLARARRLPQRAAWVAAAAVAVTILATGRWFVPVDWTIGEYTLGHSTVRSANEWAIDHGVPRTAVIVFDDLAYFDRRRFPGAHLHGGVLTWRAVESLDPDYVVLSSSLFGAEWMHDLIATQRLARSNPDPFNVRLYQDLLPTRSPGPTKVPGVRLAGVIRAAGGEESRLAGWSDACSRSRLCDVGIVDLGAELRLGARVERRLRALADAGDRPIVGPELRLYRLARDRAATAQPAASRP